MPKNRITDLIKKQISDNPKWEITMAQAEGAIMAQACYTFKPQVLSVVMPYAQSIEYVKIMMKDWRDGKKVTALQMQPDDDYSYLSVPDPVDWNYYYDIEGLGADAINAIYGAEVITKETTTTETASSEGNNNPGGEGGEPEVPVDPPNPDPGGGEDPTEPPGEEPTTEG